jgi:hypothetical protein
MCMPPRLCLLPTVLATLGLGLLPARGDDKTEIKTYTDPAEAGPDFEVQGEYAGEIRASRGPRKVGVQVIALGDGKFHAVLYEGGLPGDGWDRKTKRQGEGELKDGVAVFKGGEGSGRVQDQVLTLSDSSGNSVGRLERIERESPTLGMEPPEGAVVLFDGSSADAFEGGRLTDDGLLMQGVTSKQKFGDCKLHLEFRTPFMPAARGQARGNSGCYLQGRYEVQILDSFGLEGKDNECGGIYSIRSPDQNMCLPPLAWQTYDIDYTAARYDESGNKASNARMTVRHNGVMIHEQVELPHVTTAAPVAEGAEKGPLFLQDHGNPLRFRNTWLVEQ